MLILYRILINLILLISPIIFIYRIIRNKEEPRRSIEKIGVKTFKENYKNVIWFHVSSVGELLSIIPLIEKIEKKIGKKRILVTSNTVSSAKVFKTYNFRKTIHQYFPIDANIIINKFLNNWKPNIAIFVESEIWPNMIFEIKKRKIPLILLNARISNKSFTNWKRMKFISKNIFEMFDVCMSQNIETKIYLKKLGSKYIVSPGNLKFTEASTYVNFKLPKSVNNFFTGNKIVFGGISTHETEEEFCIKVLMKLKKKFKNIVLILIPRHINRIDKILENILQYQMPIHRHSDRRGINKNTEVYIVDTFGETKKFLDKCSVVFLGGSLIPHGGQNPLEAARFGLKITHGPHIRNFTDVYNLLEKIGISFKIKSEFDAFEKIENILKYKSKRKQNVKKLKLMGQKILNENYKYISRYL